MLARPRFDWRDPGVRRVLIAMGPAVIGVSAAQISALINTQLAASLGDGRISWITYADRLMEFPSALLGVALGTVLLPSLAKLHAERGTTSTRRCSTGVAACVPARAAGGRRAVDPRDPAHLDALPVRRFSLEDVLQTRTALLGYSVGLLGLIVVKILAPGFYARQVMSTPVKIAFATVLVSQTLALILMQQIGHAGLTLATSIGACFNASLLFWFLKRRGIYARAGLAAVLSKLVIALFVLARTLLWIGGPRRSGSRRRCGRRSAASRCARGWASRISRRCGCWDSARDFNRRDVTADHPPAGATTPARDSASAALRCRLVLRYGQRGLTQSA
jgi:putative peptidoglycan lipid II flippase